ncbi:MAG: protein kinase [Hylemonella sp.]|nr:protein kinase [Hylemonella sp.]
MSRTKLGRYELVRVLGKGAMGLVYEGRDPNLERRVAIKTIKVENLSSEEAADYEIRFRTEARSAARLQHPNIVSVYDSDRDGDIAYLVMEFIQGEDLKHHLDQGQRYTLQEAAAIMADLLSALDYAHQQNIVHRDIKPANLLIEASGRIKLTDFGVARIQDSGEATRTKGTMVGTLKYMSPEQLQGLPIDARSDLFSAGIVLYQLLTSARPFDGTGDYDIIQKIIGQAAEPPSTLNPHLPPAIDQLVARALEKSRDARFPTAQAFNVALQAAAATAIDPTVTPPRSPARPAESSTWTSTVMKGESLVSSRSGSLSGVPSSTVTQEVELVYWKEIKDSEDVEDFQDFLLKFPSGIYADLARRRLKRLGNPGGEHSGSRSGTGTGTRSGTAAAAPPDEPTLKISSAAAAAQAEELEATRMLAPRAGTAPADTLAPAAGSAPGTGADRPPQHATPPARSKRGWLLGGVGTAVVAALALGYSGLARPPSPGAEPAALKQEAVEPPKTAVSKDAAPGKTAQTPRSVEKPKSAEAKSSEAKAAETKPAPRPVAKTTAPVPANTKTEAPPAPKTADKAAAPPDPTRECEGRILLGYLTCMKQQCDKPSYAKHPVCVERREMEQRAQPPV